MYVGVYVYTYTCTYVMLYSTVGMSPRLSMYII